MRPLLLFVALAVAGSLPFSLRAAEPASRVEVARYAEQSYVADYANGAKISVRQLLDHTSGVKSYTDIPGVMDGPINKDVSTAQLIGSFKNEKPDFAPGEAWAYNNSGYVLVGAVIEAASGQPWHEYLRQVLFEPPGLVDTGYGADPVIVARQVHAE